MWLYLVAGLLVGFMVVERNSSARQFSPVQSLIFRPQGRTYERDHPGIVHYTPQGACHEITYHFSPAVTTDGFDTGIILYLHGNAEDAVGASSTVQMYQDHLNSRGYVRYHAVCMEYPGYGSSYEDGSCAPATNDGELSAMAATLLDHLKRQYRVDAIDIIVIGRSIGTGVACQLANLRHIGRLVLISPFTRLKDVIHDIVGSSITTLIGERFDNVSEMKDHVTPTLILHGRSDRLIPVSHAVELAKCAPSTDAIRRIVIMDGDHNALDHGTIAEHIGKFAIGS
jgi:pimeloyl-ACP methyl ester carboxylesterase